MGFKMQSTFTFLIILAKGVKAGKLNKILDNFFALLVGLTQIPLQNAQTIPGNLEDPSTNSPPKHPLKGHISNFNNELARNVGTLPLVHKILPPLPYITVCIVCTC